MDTSRPAHCCALYTRLLEANGLIPAALRLDGQAALQTGVSCGVQAQAVGAAHQGQAGAMVEALAEVQGIGTLMSLPISGPCWTMETCSKLTLCWLLAFTESILKLNLLIN